ncbi:hypothetical protein JCM8115_000733 [Rhodotorula mucilaginosa]|uniref:Regulator of ime2 n=1 Tax=Rhodotorula mucilaginosa TaxID=5537 RepID=A0A9P6W2B8_RHOMI|nr:regulator of ime2 [Rhodotorula mucilaginosa]TKA56965.1 Glycogen synthase kinase-3 beta [Rhodotorula sp. CCFEE 5036]
MDVSRPPPLDFPLSLNPTAGGPSSPSSFAPVTRAILPFSLLVNYIGPHSPLSWSRPGSPSSPSTPITASTTTTTTHVSQTASTASPRVRTRSRSRSFRLRSSRSSPVTISSLTESNPPATTSLALSAAPDPPLTPPASPRSRPGQPSLALVSSTLASLRSAPPPSTSSSLLSIADESSKVVKVVASHGRTGDQIELTYSSTKVVGNGSFGVVFAAKLAPGSLGSDNEGDDDVAIKKVLQDKRFKNRELQIMRLVRHPNVVNLRAFFYSNGDKPKKDEVYLNLVLEYVPETVYRASRHYAKLKQTMPMAYIKLYMYQLMRSLAYIHSVGICHRDIKPQNLLLNPPTGVLKLCDFGSAKILIEGEPNVSYICSRYYRAPELIFGATNYTTNIDVWSAGCVMAELMLGQPLFPGESGIDQLVEIIKVLGTPSREQIKTMNPNYMEHKFPQIKPHPFVKVFRPRTPPEAIDLISKLLEYTPSARLTAIEAMCHPFFDELKAPDAKMPTGKDMPPLFDFTREELSCRPDLISQLVPQHAEAALLERGIDVHNFDPIPLEQMRLQLD